MTFVIHLIWMAIEDHKHLARNKFASVFHKMLLVCHKFVCKISFSLKKWEWIFSGVFLFVVKWMKKNEYYQNANPNKTSISVQIIKQFLILKATYHTKPFEECIFLYYCIKYIKKKKLLVRPYYCSKVIIFSHDSCNNNKQNAFASEYFQNHRKFKSNPSGTHITPLRQIPHFTIII